MKESSVALIGQPSTLPVLPRTLLYTLLVLFARILFEFQRLKKESNVALTGQVANPQHLTCCINCTEESTFDKHIFLVLSCPVLLVLLKDSSVPLNTPSCVPSSTPHIFNGIIKLLSKILLQMKGNIAGQHSHFFPHCISLDSILDIIDQVVF